MKLVVAVIQPAKLSAVREALVNIEVERMTICDAQSYDRDRRQPGVEGEPPFKTDLLRECVLEIVVNDDFLDRTIEAVGNAARTGVEANNGDGKMFILPVQQSIQIGPTTRGPGAV